MHRSMYVSTFFYPKRLLIIGLCLSIDVASAVQHILGVTVTHQDMQAIDPDYYKNLLQITTLPLEDLGLDLTFSADTEMFGAFVCSVLPLPARPGPTRPHPAPAYLCTGLPSCISPHASPILRPTMQPSLEQYLQTRIRHCLYSSSSTVLVLSFVSCRAPNNKRGLPACLLSLLAFPTLSLPTLFRPVNSSTKSRVLCPRV